MAGSNEFLLVYLLISIQFLGCNSIDTQIDKRRIASDVIESTILNLDYQYSAEGGQVDSFLIIVPSGDMQKVLLKNQILLAQVKNLSINEKRASIISNDHRFKNIEPGYKININEFVFIRFDTITVSNLEVIAKIAYGRLGEWNIFKYHFDPSSFDITKKEFILYSIE